MICTLPDNWLRQHDVALRDAVELLDQAIATLDAPYTTSRVQMHGRKVITLDKLRAAREAVCLAQLPWLADPPVPSTSKE